MAEHPSEVAEHAAEVADHAAEKVGMPQIDFASFPNQIFWLLITLVVIYLVLTRIALPRIGSVLADRQSTITNDIAAADELKQKSIEAEEVYNQAWRTPAPKLAASLPRRALISKLIWTWQSPKPTPRLLPRRRNQKRRLPRSAPVRWTASSKCPGMRRMKLS